MEKIIPGRSEAQLILYGRGYCHLCEDMAVGLRALGLQFAEIDVDTAPSLEALFGDKVPVLTVRMNGVEHEICHYHLDDARVRRALSEVGGLV